MFGPVVNGGRSRPMFGPVVNGGRSRPMFGPVVNGGRPQLNNSKALIKTELFH